MESNSCNRYDFGILVVEVVFFLFAVSCIAGMVGAIA